MTAAELIEFDKDSIRRLGDPDVWVVDRGAYEKDGRVLRDSETPRMLAYSTKDHVLYATDGCNSCQIAADLKSVQVQEFAEENELPLALLQRLVSQL